LVERRCRWYAHCVSIAVYTIFVTQRTIFFALVSRLAEYKLEYLAVYGRGSMGVPVGELQYGKFRFVLI